MESYKNNIEQGMKKAIVHLQTQFGKVSTGRASAAMLEGVKFDYHGEMMEIPMMAAIGTPEPRQLLITPFDKGAVKAIVSAIHNADLGFSPVDEGDKIRISIPALTEETRKQKIKDASAVAEESKVTIRNLRRDLIQKAKALKEAKELTEDDVKSYEDDAQKLTDKYVSEIETMFKAKSDDLMTV